jgi:hypothetical protein
MKDEKKIRKIPKRDEKSQKEMKYVRKKGNNKKRNERI